MLEGLKKLQAEKAPQKLNKRRMSCLFSLHRIIVSARLEKTFKITKSTFTSGLQVHH